MCLGERSQPTQRASRKVDKQADRLRDGHGNGGGGAGARDSEGGYDSRWDQEEAGEEDEWDVGGGGEAKADKEAGGAFYFNMSPAVKARSQQVKRIALSGSRTPICLVQQIYFCCCCLHALSTRLQHGELISSLLLCAGYTR